MSLEGAVLEQPKVDEKKVKEERFNSMLKDWGFQESTVNPLNFAKTTDIAYPEKFNENAPWRVYVVIGLERNNRKNPRTSMVCSSYDSPDKIALAIPTTRGRLIEVTEIEEKGIKKGIKLEPKNVGVIIHDRKQNKYYTGYLSPTQNPESRYALASQF